MMMAILNATPTEETLNGHQFLEFEQNPPPITQLIRCEISKCLRSQNGVGAASSSLAHERGEIFHNRQIGSSIVSVAQLFSDFSSLLG